MKELRRKEKYQRFQERRQKRSLKRRKQVRRRKKHLHRLLHGKPRVQHGNIKLRMRYTEIKAPSSFSLLTNTEETISFINEIENCFTARKRVFVVLEKVTQIDPSAITVLLSVMYKFKIARIKFNGDFPEDEGVKQKLVDSQFFEKLMKPLSSKIDSDYILRKENQIFARANRIVVSEMGEKIMEEASQTIWGKKRICKGLQKTLLELMQNTNNHASTSQEGEVYWWLSVNHNKEDHSVDFYFVDYGQGILGSLSHRANPKIWSKFWQNMEKMIESGSEPQIIESLLKGEHRSPKQRDRPYYRGKGLPSIKNSLDRNQISGLQVITNNTFTDVEKGSFSRLSKNFNGTFFHWKLCQENLNEVWR